MPKKYVKKPILIEAVQYTGKNQDEIADFYPQVCGAFSSDCIFITTLEGTMSADVGDYIIKGIKGEFYPCKPDIFEASYSEVV